MNFKILISLFIIPIIGWSQKPEDTIDIENVNIKYLEHLVKKEIDDVRLNLEMPILINDSILYLASENHASYLNKNQELSHYEKKGSNKYSPQLRAEFYGAKNYQVGENIVQISLHSKTDLKNGALKTFTYQDAAKTMRLLWVNSPGHYANITTIDYDITGVAINYNPSKNELRCVQKFAAINNLYIYKKSENFFPFADDIPNDLLLNFEPKKSKNHKKHAYGIKENKKHQICSEIRTSIFNIKTIAINIDDDSLSLGFRKGDLSKIKAYFKHKKDGLSVEIVLFKYNYSCNLTDNYVIPTRRNGQCEFDGYISPPIFKTDILEAIKAKEDYLASKRIRLHKDEFLMINVGEFPALAKNEKINANLIIYTQNRVCKIIEGVGVCGKKLTNSLPKVLIKKDFLAPNFELKDSSQMIKFRVPFNQNETSFDRTIVDKKIKELNTSDFLIHKAILKAYSSVEGSLEINKKLFEKRAQVIMKCFEENQNDNPIKFKLKTTENWQLFYNQIKNTPYAHLLNIDTLEVRKFVNAPSNLQELEKYFKAQRYVDVRIYLKPKITTKSKIKYAQLEFKTILNNNKLKPTHIKRLQEIQSFLFSEVIKGNISYQDLKIEDINEPSIHYERLVFDYLHNPNKISNVKFTNELKTLLNTTDFHPIGLEIEYYISAFNSSEYLEYKEEQKRLGQVIKYLKENSVNNAIIDDFSLRIQHNHINEYYGNSGGVKYKTVKKSKINLYNYYNEKLNDFDDEFKFKIAQYFIFMNETHWAMPILKELISKPKYNHKHYQLYVKSYYYLRAFDSSFADYELVVMDSAEKLSNKEWCNLFIGPCNISLPIFDNQSIKNLYCAKCQ